MKLDATLLKVVNSIIKVNNIPMLLGEPGIGKSSWLEDLAKLNNTKCFTLACNQLGDKTDLTGVRMLPVTDDDGKILDYKQSFYPHITIYDAIDYANNHPNETPILFLDELNRSTPDITSALLSIPTSRAIGNKILPDNLKIVIAGNDKGNITALDDASISRFVLLNVEPDVDVFFKIHPQLNPIIKNVLELKNHLLFCKETGADDEYNEYDEFEFSDKMCQFTTPRTIHKLSDFLNEIGNGVNDLRMEDSIKYKNLLEEILIGFTGNTEFTKEVYNKIIDSIALNNEAKKMVSEPKIFDTLINITSIDELNKTISNNLTMEEKRNLLIYCLSSYKNNLRYIIESLALYIDEFTQNDINVIANLEMANRLNENNIKILLNTNTSCSKSIELLFNI